MISIKFEEDQKSKKDCLNVTCNILKYNAGLGLKSRSQKCVGGDFSLKLGQLDPGQEISTRFLSVNLAIILLWFKSTMAAIDHYEKI